MKVVNGSILLACLVFVSACFRKAAPWHFVSEDCCKSRNGTVCGLYVKDCCRGDCQEGILGSQWCAEGQEYVPDCQTCIDICKRKDGIACGVLATQKTITCCEPNFCRMPAGNRDIIATFINTFSTDFSKVMNYTLTGFPLVHNGQWISDTQKTINALDELTSAGKCEKGHVIEIGKCIQDSWIQILFAKFFS